MKFKFYFDSQNYDPSHEEWEIFEISIKELKAFASEMPDDSIISLCVRKEDFISACIESEDNK